MKLKKIKFNPIDYQNQNQEEAFNEKLKGAIHVETYTESAIGCGEARTLVIFAFYPDDFEFKENF